jgi:uncharacterized delta-60 repeat protein
LTQADGKIICIHNNLVYRYLINGTLDSAFGQNGSTIDSSTSGYGDAVLQADGKILTTSWGSSAVSSLLIITRFKANGGIDSTFGANGKSTIVLPATASMPEKLIEDHQGNVVILITQVFGSEPSCFGLGIKPSKTNFSVLRLNPAGIIDSSFGTNGVSDTLFNTKYALPQRIIQQPDGKYLIAGEVRNVCFEQENLGMVRINSNGMLDSSFANNGRLLKFGNTTPSIWGTNIFYSDLIVTNANEIFAFGADSAVYIIDKYGPTGAIDSAFGINGRQSFSQSSWEPSRASLLLDSTIMISHYPNVLFLDMNGDFADSCRYKHAVPRGGYEVTYSAPDNFYQPKQQVGFQKLILTHPQKSDSIKESVCAKYIFNGKEYRNSGQYQETLQTAQGCDSLIFLDLDITPVDNTVTQMGITLTANATNATYQWINCNTQQAIAGETNQTFIATANGSYAVIVTENGCTDTSGCFTVSGIGLEEMALAGINIYPNPSKGYLVLGFETTFVGNLEIYSLSGQRVYQHAINGQPKLELELELANGVYVLKLTSPHKNFNQRLIIQ